MIIAGVPVVIDASDERMAQGLFFNRQRIADAKVRELSRAISLAVGGQL